MTEQYTAPEGATHQNIGMPDLFYKAGSDGKVLYRRAANLSPDDIWEPSGYEENDALANTTVFRPLTPTWRDGAPPEVGWWRARNWPEPTESKPKEYAPGVWHEWPGGECPVIGRGAVCTRDGGIYEAKFRSWFWRHIGSDGDVFAFFIGTEDEACAALQRKPAEGSPEATFSRSTEQIRAARRRTEKQEAEPHCRTPADIEGEPAVLARCELYQAIDEHVEAASPHFSPDRARLLGAIAETRRSLLTIATPDHRLGYWGQQGDES